MFHKTLLRKTGAFGLFGASGAYIYQQNSTKLPALAQGNVREHRLLSWGSSNQGQLGHGREGESLPTATQIEALEGTLIRQVEAFHEKTAVVTEDGQLLLWGRTRDGSIVDGNGGAFRTNLAAPFFFEESGGALFSQVSCGKDHVAAVTRDGRLLTFGNPTDGKLGHPVEAKAAEKRSVGRLARGRTSDYAKLGFVEIADVDEAGVTTPQKVKQVSCGFRHTACVTEDGSLYTWGAGRSGQLGQGDFDDVLEPKKLDLSLRVEKVLCGANFTVILDDRGRLYAFGDNRYGQLGITGLDNVVLAHPAGIQTFLRKVKDFACGEDHAAYVDHQGNVYTWGYGLEGQLGHGDTNSIPIPKKVQLTGKVDQVACGGGHTAFLTEQNELWMCGKGRDGQLGRGDQLESTAFPRTAPVKVTSLPPGSVVEAVALGSNHSIALATAAE